MDMAEIIPVEFIPGLTWMGKQDWVHYHMHPTEGRTSVDSVVAFPPRNDDEIQRSMMLIKQYLSSTGAGSAIFWLPISKALAQGPKLLRASADQCRAMEQAEIRLRFDEYEQPYPAVFVELPPEYRHELTKRFGLQCPRYVLVYHDRSTSYIFAHAYGIDVCNILPPRSCYPIIEAAMKSAWGDTGTDIDLADVVQRVALNLCLLLTCFGVVEHGPASPARLKKLRRTAGKSRGAKALHAQTRMESMPKLISFRQEVKFPAFSRHHGKSDTGLGQGCKKVHWRRGHFRRQRIGRGRMGSKLIFIEYMMINRRYFLGEDKDTSAVYVSPKPR